MGCRRYLFVLHNHLDGLAGCRAPVGFQKHSRKLGGDARIGDRLPSAAAFLPALSECHPRGQQQHQAHPFSPGCAVSLTPPSRFPRFLSMLHKVHAFFLERGTSGPLLPHSLYCTGGANWMLVSYWFYCGSFVLEGLRLGHTVPCRRACRTVCPASACEGRPKREVERFAQDGKLSGGLSSVFLSETRR